MEMVEQILLLQPESEMDGWMEVPGAFTISDIQSSPARDECMPLVSEVT